MIFEGEFFFRGVPRWNLGWPTPNYAGAFLATLLPWCWVWSGRWDRWGWRGLTALGFAGEMMLWLALARTYSRGALVAALGAGVFVWLTTVGPRGRPGGTPAGAGGRPIPPMLRASLAILAIGVSGFSARLAPAYLAGDGAVGNRLALWRGGLEMLAAAPLRGWGAGESGRAYMNWFQEVDRTEGYATMVNSYLHVGVEHGLVALGAVMFGLGWGLAVAWGAARRNPAWLREGWSASAVAAIAGGSLLAWAVANVFSTLWIEPRLWIVPMLAVGTLAWAVRRAGAPRGGLGPSKRPGRARVHPAAVGVALVAAGLCTGFSWGAGAWLRRSRDGVVFPDPAGRGAVFARNAGSVGARIPVWQVWPDPVVLGPAPGREIRRWLVAPDAPDRVVVHDPLAGPGTKSGEARDPVLLCGRQAARLGQGVGWDHELLVLLHPVGLPPALAPERATNSNHLVLILPGIDEVGNMPRWREWALAARARLVVSPEVGTDVRLAWPEVVRDLRNVAGSASQP